MKEKNRRELEKTTENAVALHENGGARGRRKEHESENRKAADERRERKKKKFAGKRRNCARLRRGDRGEGNVKRERRS